MIHVSPCTSRAGASRSPCSSSSVIRRTSAHSNADGKSSGASSRKAGESGQFSPLTTNGLVNDYSSVVSEGVASGGRLLDAHTRQSAASGFGFDFSQVRVHDDRHADASARRLDARAYTVGRDMVFRTGAYEPSTATGRQLLAHELAHVAQNRAQPIDRGNPMRLGDRNDSAERDADRMADAAIDGRRPGVNATPTNGNATIRRACGSRAIGKPSGCTGLSGFPFGDIFKFKKSCDEFITGEDASLASFGRSLAPADRIKIHGLASTDGKAPFNENLSCARARAAAQLLTGPGPIGAGLSNVQIAATYKHGSQPGPVSMTRSAVIETIAGAKPKAKPKPRPKPKPKFVCGPDVTKQVSDAVSNTKTKFGGWSAKERGQACQALTSYKTGGYAWDIVDLHNNAWIHKTYRPGCATKGAKPPCGSSVQVGKSCWYAGSPNYVIFGVMFKECNAHYKAAGKPGDAADFTKAEMKRLVKLYKGPKFSGLKKGSKNFIDSRKWAAAGFDGWPGGGKLFTGDRMNCAPVCATPYSGSAFRVRWVPHGMF